MIVSKAPLRISFFGGGTDLPEYYEKYFGMVVSTTINVNMHIVLNGSPQERVKACYDLIEIVNTSREIKHNRIRECLLHYNVLKNIEVSSFCHIPTKGTGLGSSSSFTVALCGALDCYTGSSSCKYKLADQAFFVERNLCGEKLGKQDQYASSFGGFRSYVFSKDSVNTRVLKSNKSTFFNLLESNLLYFYTGISRNADDILKSQVCNLNYDVLHKMKDLTKESIKLVEKDKVDEFGKLLDETWKLKKNLNDKISLPIIDEYYESAIKSGALGGKLLGAGGGGFLMFYVPKHKQESVINSLIHLKKYNFKFSESGADIVYRDI